MKVLFLDHDGVICLATQWGGRFKKKGYDSNPKTPMDIRMDDFDKKCVKVLNEIVDETGCEIVVTSDWKRWGGLDDMREMYSVRGVKEPLDITPDMVDFMPSEYDILKATHNFESIRVHEINEWLRNHPEVTHWVVIDDLDLSELNNFVLTKRPHSEGIKQSGIKEKLLKYLIG